MADIGRRFVVVSGPPASGKSTIAPAIAAHLGLPLIAKDTIKETLMSALGAPDVETSKRLGRAAVATVFALATESPVGAVLDGNFHRSIAVDALAGLPGSVVEVFCRCSRDETAGRYAARAGTRHPGHFDEVRSAEDLWTPETSEPIAGGWPVLEVNTEHPLDLAEVLAFVDLTG